MVTVAVYHPFQPLVAGGVEKLPSALHIKPGASSLASLTKYPLSNGSFIHSAVGTRENHIISPRWNSCMLVPKKSQCGSRSPVTYKQAGTGLIFMGLSIDGSKAQAT